MDSHPDPLSGVLRLLSRESPSGAMKAVLRKAGGTGPGEEKQFLEVSHVGTGGGHWGTQLGTQPLCWEADSLTPRCPQVWEKNRKLKSFNLSALEKHGPVYEDGKAAGWRAGRVTGGRLWPRTPSDWLSLHPDCFGCLSWSHSETHLLYVAEKKRPKAESFFQTKALDIGGSDDEMARLRKPDQAIKVLMTGQPFRAALGCRVLPTHLQPSEPSGAGSC